MLIEAANRTNGLLKSSPPFVLWCELADYAINYRINGYTIRGSRMPIILCDPHRDIVAVFTENDAQILMPSYIANPQQPKIPNHEWDSELKTPKNSG